MHRKFIITDFLKTKVMHRLWLKLGRLAKVRASYGNFSGTF